jgi:CheY-like chemotaxis protein
MRIMLVDDNADVAGMLKSLLEYAGHDVRCALDGEEALSAPAEFQPVAVCLDLGLPDIDGYELAVKLREEAGLADARFVALSGRPSEPERLKQAGIAGHLLKPASAADVLRALTDRA